MTKHATLDELRSALLEANGRASAMQKSIETFLAAGSQPCPDCAALRDTCYAALVDRLNAEYQAEAMQRTLDAMHRRAMVAEAKWASVPTWLRVIGGAL